ncbi:hypothetical protein TSAR_014479 [Trichomalopsis sarcophagae]|uniref:Uncharacterized protein n=1 Tax=Trichomalopsis sarcophagae TaxID=543379 RepID=A0A232EK19_9HYME|nr:hypothetical protein TSAR_014479 [Trichomalopsis sarcophagae]
MMYCIQLVLPISMTSAAATVTDGENLRHQPPRAKKQKTAYHQPSISMHMSKLEECVDKVNETVAHIKKFIIDCIKNDCIDKDPISILKTCKVFQQYYTLYTENIKIIIHDKFKDTIEEIILNIILCEIAAFQLFDITLRFVHMFSYLVINQKILKNSFFVTSSKPHTLLPLLTTLYKYQLCISMFSLLRVHLTGHNRNTDKHNMEKKKKKEGLDRKEVKYKPASGFQKYLPQYSSNTGSFPKKEGYRSYCPDKEANKDSKYQGHNNTIR